MITSTAGCDGGAATPEVEYRPVLLPIKFTVGKDGVDVSGQTRLITPIGEFGINIKKALHDRPAGAVHVIIRDRNRGPHGSDRVYLVRAGGDAIKVIVDGRTEIDITDGQVVVDVTDGDVQEFQLARLEPVGQVEENAIAAWWHEADRRWDAGWAESIYHPFMLTRWAYDDSTIGKGYGAGFVWFLLRLFLALLLLLVDLVLTALFLVAQLAYHLWGPTGRNVVWGVAVLGFLIVTTMFVAALRQ